jgi:hypothetical protein
MTVDSLWESTVGVVGAGTMGTGTLQSAGKDTRMTSFLERRTR